MPETILRNELVLGDSTSFTHTKASAILENARLELGTSHFTGLCDWSAIGENNPEKSLHDGCNVLTKVVALQPSQKQCKCRIQF